MASETRGEKERFEFDATLDELAAGLEAIHRSVRLLCEFAGRRAEERSVMQLETALGEVGANVLTHGRPSGAAQAVRYSLRLDGDAAVAEFVDGGPPSHDQLRRAMPVRASEEGRGLSLARLLLDELEYERDGESNMWRLVKRL